LKIEIDLKITEVALGELKKAVAEMGDSGVEQLIRISVQGGGCSGFSYGLGFSSSDEVIPGDVVEEYEGVKLVVDKKSLFYLDGTTIDWVEEGDHSGFKFQSQNAKKTCGCKNSSCR
jgi:iron-sulfur cluster assembly protein